MIKIHDRGCDSPTRHKTRTHLQGVLGAACRARAVALLIWAGHHSTHSHPPPQDRTGQDPAGLTSLQTCGSTGTRTRTSVRILEYPRWRVRRRLQRSVDKAVSLASAQIVWCVWCVWCLAGILKAVSSLSFSDNSSQYLVPSSQGRVIYSKFQVKVGRLFFFLIIICLPLRLVSLIHVPSLCPRHHCPLSSDEINKTTRRKKADFDLEFYEY